MEWFCPIRLISTPEMGVVHFLILAESTREALHETDRQTDRPTLLLLLVQLGDAAQCFDIATGQSQIATTAVRHTVPLELQSFIVS